MKKTRTHKIWYGIKKRVVDGSSRAKEFYLQRGITICSGWNIYDNFLADMGERPSKSYSVDRIDNNGGYWCGHCEECVKNNWPANCRWATAIEQANNRRSNIKVEYNGKTLSLSEWCREFKIKSTTLRLRYKRGLRPPELFKPNPLGNRIKSLKNSWKIRKFTTEQINEIKLDFSLGLTNKQIADKYGVSQSTIDTLPNAIYYKYPNLEDAIAYLTEEFEKQLDLNQVIDDNKT